MDLVSLARGAIERATTRRGDRLGVDVAPEAIRAHLRARYAFDHPVPLEALMADVDDLLTRFTEHATHPRHLGLFRPAPDPLCAVADAMTAAHDPNLATWDFAPAANEIERHVLDALAAAFGLPGGGLHHFTSGGQEANHTAVIAALTRQFPLRASTACALCPDSRSSTSPPRGMLPWTRSPRRAGSVASPCVGWPPTASSVCLSTISRGRSPPTGARGTSPSWWWAPRAPPPRG
jgi:hypothetical protein